MSNLPFYGYTQAGGYYNQQQMMRPQPMQQHIQQDHDRISRSGLLYEQQQSRPLQPQHNQPMQQKPQEIKKEIGDMLSDVRRNADKVNQINSFIGGRSHESSVDEDPRLKMMFNDSISDSLGDSDSDGEIQLGGKKKKTKAKSSTPKKSASKKSKSKKKKVVGKVIEEDMKGVKSGSKKRATKKTTKKKGTKRGSKRQTGGANTFIADLSKVRKAIVDADNGSMANDAAMVSVASQILKNNNREPSKAVAWVKSNMPKIRDMYKQKKASMPAKRKSKKKKGSA